MFQITNDPFDQIGSFKYDRKTGEYTLRTNRHGDARTLIDEIEKGILSDKINFFDENNVIDINGEGKPSLEGFERFLVDFADLIRLEIAGLYMADIGGNDIKYAYVHQYKNNSYNHSVSPYMLPDSKSYLRDIAKPIESFHTHPSDHPNRLNPSPKDIKFKAGQTKNGIKKFYILTKGEKITY